MKGLVEHGNQGLQLQQPSSIGPRAGSSRIGQAVIIKVHLLEIPALIQGETVNLVMVGTGEGREAVFKVLNSLIQQLQLVPFLFFELLELSVLLGQEPRTDAIISNLAPLPTKG